MLFLFRNTKREDLAVFKEMLPYFGPVLRYSFFLNISFLIFFSVPKSRFKYLNIVQSTEFSNVYETKDFFSIYHLMRYTRSRVHFAYEMIYLLKNTYELIEPSSIYLSCNWHITDTNRREKKNK